MIDLIAISPKRESIGIEVKIFNNIQNYNEIINFYGRLAILRSNFSLDKLLLVTNEKCIVEICICTVSLPKRSAFFSLANIV